MIAYLQGKDVTVEVPDDIGNKDLSDLNQHFDTLVKPEGEPAPANPVATRTDPQTPVEATAPSKNASPTWTPNFYESFIKPILPGLTGPAALAVQMGETPERRAFTGKAAEEFTFGATKPIADPMLSEDYKQHPVYANLGAMAGGVGSLLATGGALKAAGLAEKAAQVGAEAADTFAAAPRFLPRAIMTGATFGTQQFIKETVKAFQEGNVDLPTFGEHILGTTGRVAKATALGGFLGTIGGLSNVPTAIASAAGLGFVSSKMDGGDNAEATLNGGIWAIFEAVGSYGRTAELRSEALKTLGDSIGEYVQNKDPNIAPEQAKAAGEAIVRQAAERVGGLDAVVNGEKGETLQLIEDINQQVRQGKIQEPVEAPGQLEGPAAEGPAKPGEIGAPAAPAPREPATDTPLAPVPGEKPVNLDDQGLPKLRPKAVVATVEDPDGKAVKITHEMVLEEANGLKDAEKQTFQQANPLAQFVLDNGGVRGFKGGMESEEFKDVPLRFRGSKALDEMAQEAYNAGLLDEPNADLLRVELASVGKRAEPKPMAELYEQAKQNLSSFFSSTLPGEIPTEMEPGVAFSRAPGSGDLIDAKSENVADRYERVRQQALSQGMNPAQASAHAKNVLRGKPAPAGQSDSNGKPLKQQEFGTAGGVQGFGQGRQGEGELNFSRTPKASGKQTETPAFKKWFGDSKVVDAEGKPLVVYHGSRQVFTKFDKEWIGRNFPDFTIGFNFISDPKQASGYAIPTSDDFEDNTFPNVKPVFIKIENPLIFESDTQTANAHADLERREIIHRLVQAKNAGNPHDGVIIRGPDATQVIVFDSKQIKSATGNRGTFDAKNPNINYSVAPGGKVADEPVIKQVADHFKESATEIRDIVAPGKAAPLAERITRENLGKMARSYDKAEASLEEAGKLFDSQPKEVNLAFIDKMEHGQKQDDPQFEVIAKTLRNLLDSKRKEIQSLGTGKLSAFIENYFPHIWDQGEKGVSQAIQKAAKRPLEGGKAFLKKRKIEFTNDGIEMGLTPISYNPVDLTLLKIREMDKYLMAHQTLKEFKDTGLAKYVKIGGEVPEGWTKIDDKVSTVFKSPMIAVQEAYDEEMVNRLDAVAKSLGVELNRKTSLGRHKGMPAGVWGYSESQTPGQPGKVTTKFGGPESVIAHELGHQLDNIYGMQSRFLTPESEAEFSKLASLREGENADQDFKKYIQKPEERMAVMLESYIHAPQLFKENAPTLFKKFETFLDSRPELRPLTEIKPSLVMGQNESEVYAGGAVIAGHIWAQPDAARIINNYLSPGFAKSAIYRGVRFLGNALNQAQLGFSLFHMNFTSTEAMATQVANSLQAVLDGDPKQFAKSMAKVPVASVSTVIRGDRLLKAWRGQGQSALDEQLANILAISGGRARMDQFYSTKMIEHMKHNFQTGRYVPGLFQAPLAALDLASKPIMEMLVPRMKLGIWAEMMEPEIKKNQNMTHDEQRIIGGKIWDTVDDRMGQIVYDNLFWPKTFKDSLMLVFRSVGWNHGLLRLVLGGARDAGNVVGSILKGEKPEKAYRLMYWIGNAILVFSMNALYQYVKTGKGPQELKDYVFPRNGGLDKDGNPSRSIPFQNYFKDLYHMGTAPVQTFTNKLNPFPSMLSQALSNKDFYGTKILNEDDPVVRQLISEAEFLGRFVQPFSYRNMIHNLNDKNRSLESVIGPWLGDVPAPYDINQTKAEKLAHEIAASHIEVGGRTQEQVAKSKFLGDIRQRVSTGDQSAMQDLMKAVSERQISRTEAVNAIQTSRMTPLQRVVHSFSYDELQRVYKKANEEEKAQIEPLLRRREISNIRQFGEPTGRMALP